MTKPERMTKPEARRNAPVSERRLALQHSGFLRHSTFGLRHLSYLHRPRLLDRFQHRKGERHARARFYIREWMLLLPAQERGPGRHFFTVTFGGVGGGFF